MLDIKANNTVLEQYQIVVLDSGRLSVPVPKWGFLHFDSSYHDTLGYKYYVEDSNRYQLLRLMYDPENGDQRWAFDHFMNVVLRFESEHEKACFEDYVDYNLAELKRRIDDSTASDYINTGNTEKTKGYKQSLRAAVVLKEMLEEFRRFCQDLDYKD